MPNTERKPECLKLNIKAPAFSASAYTSRIVKKDIGTSLYIP